MDEMTAPSQGIPHDVQQLFKLLVEQVLNKGCPPGVYANNFRFEPSVWDLKMLLGQLGQRESKPMVEWHTAVTIPWHQVKLLAYFLRLQAAWHEQQSGEIKIPATVVPKKPEPPSGEAATDPGAKAYYETAKKIYREMFG